MVHFSLLAGKSYYSAPSLQPARPSRTSNSSELASLILSAISPEASRLELFGSAFRAIINDYGPPLAQKNRHNCHHGGGNGTGRYGGFFELAEAHKQSKLHGKQNRRDLIKALPVI